jgi:DNA-binding beta-propeller fold protein YncE
MALAVQGMVRVARAQVEERELQAAARLFPEVGPGLRAIRRDSAGRYYVLTAPSAVVHVYASDGKPLALIPASPSKASDIVYGQGLDVDPAGRVYVADRGGNAVRVYDPNGRLALSIPVTAPTSVAVLPGGEIAVASGRSTHLVEVYDQQGKVVREFGDPSELAERADLNRFLNIGQLVTDPAGDIYYAFSYLPEPTVRKYNRYGYAAFEVSLVTTEYQPEAQAVRREIEQQDLRRSAPSFKPVVNAVAVDPDTQEIWVALGDELLHFDREGNHRETFRTFDREGARVEAISILVEPNRLLLAADPLGIYAFAHPDKVPTSSPKP